MVAVALALPSQAIGANLGADDVLPLATTASTVAPSDELTLATLAYRQASQDGRLSDALAPALRIVELTERQQPASLALGSALNDVGVLQLLLGDPASAIPHFERAIAVLEAAEGPEGVNLVTPLGGLGMALARVGKHDEAIRVLDRAADHPQRGTAIGPRDALSVLDTLVQSNRALGRADAAERRTVQAYELADGLYPRDDAARLPRLMDLGRWYESTSRKELAVPVYRRAVAIAEVSGPDATASLIDGLRALSRALTLQSVMLGVPLGEREGWMTRTPTGEIRGTYTPEQVRLVEQMAYLQYNYLPIGVLGDDYRPVAGLRGRHYSPDEEGEAAILRAAELARTTNPLPPSLVSEALIDAGDWHAIHRRQTQARRLWAEALSLPGEAGELSRERLSRPRLLAFPLSAPQIENAQRRGPKSVAVEGRFAYKVTAEGVVWEVRYVGGQLNTSEKVAARAALIAARYAPRFEGLEPVETRDVTLTSTWYRNP